MEINASITTPMPALPEAPREPPRDAEITTAVREAQGAEAGENNTRSSSNEQGERQASPSNSSLGNFVNETV